MNNNTSKAPAPKKVVLSKPGLKTTLTITKKAPAPRLMPSMNGNVGLAKAPAKGNSYA